MSDPRTPADAQRPFDAPPLDEFLPYLMNRVAGRLNQELAARLRPRRLTFQHWRVLLVLAGRDGRNMTELADGTAIPQSTLSRLIDRMQRAGLVTRRGATGDSRVVEVALTPAGRDAFAAILPVAQGVYRDAVRGIDDNGIRQFMAVLRTMGRDSGAAAEPPARAAE